MSRLYDFWMHHMYMYMYMHAHHMHMACIHTHIIVQAHIHKLQLIVWPRLSRHTLPQDPTIIATTVQTYPHRKILSALVSAPHPHAAPPPPHHTLHVPSFTCFVLRFDVLDFLVVSSAQHLNQSHLICPRPLQSHMTP